MTNHKFIIDNKDFFVSNNYLKEHKMIIKSSPRNYELIVDKNSPINSIFEIMQENDKNVLVVDKIVFNLYLKDINTKYKVFIIDSIEDNKDINTALNLISYLESVNFTKLETLVVVGGGIVQDIAAFVGATYKRGINWVFFPTTLLSMCDSCIGGKSGLNYKSVKNQIALFSSPYKIYLNINFLDTLDKNEIRSGLGEILKLCIIGGEYFISLYQSLVKNGVVNNKDDYLTLLLTSLNIKKAVIEEDEFENHLRKSLNYGHTMGHAIEVMSKYKIPHGQAVSLGMIIANELANIYGYLDTETCKLINDNILKIVNKNDITLIDVEQTLELIKKDKKVQGDYLTLVAIKEFGTTVFIKIKIDNDLFNNIKDILQKIPQ